MINLKQTLRFLPVHVIHPQANKERSIEIGEELESLIATLGGVVVDRIIQKLDNPNMGTYVGRGKVQEIAEKIKEKPTDVVVLNGMAKPGQIHTLKTELQKTNPDIEVWDRVDLILHIFDKHATTTEAKLQIELARMRYMGPRIYGMGFVLSRQGGGIGTSGIGETNTELMKRHWRKEIKTVTERLEKMSKNRQDQLEQRRRSGFKTVSIVGYTNAGKSSLFNRLTGKDVLVANILFATLDSTVAKLYLPELKQEVILTDTIGFIRNLPPKLIKAFQSTLLESLHADLLLHVIDVSDPQYPAKITVVNDILRDLGRTTDDVVYVFNKIDVAKDLDQALVGEKYAQHEPLFISTKTGKGTVEVLSTIARRLS
jgi:GTP-binding protein HflX